MNAQFHHARTECARVQTEDVSGTTRTFDAPSCVFQRLDNVFPFDFPQCFDRKRDVITCQFKAIDQLQHAALRMDHGSFDYVR